MWCFFVTRSFVCRRIMGCYGLQPADPPAAGPLRNPCPPVHWCQSFTCKPPSFHQPPRQHTDPRTKTA
jgi:hypothetical protein